MNKLLLILFFLLALFTIGFGIYFFLTKTTEMPTPPVSNTTGGFGQPPSSLTTGNSTGGKTTIGGTTGPQTSTTGDTGVPEGKLSANGVLVNDFRIGKTPDDDGVSGPSFYLGDTATTTPYKLIYYELDQGFVLTLLERPLGKTRHVVEDVMRKELGVDDATLCKLKYDLGVPQYVEAQYAGKNLKFSFCEGAVSLPEL